MPAKNSIVVYDLTDKLKDLQITINFRNGEDGFFHDQILNTDTPSSITADLKAYLNGEDVTASTIFSIVSGSGTIDNVNKTISISQTQQPTNLVVKGEHNVGATTKIGIAGVTIKKIDSTGQPTLIVDKSSIVYTAGSSGTQSINQFLIYKGQDVTQQATIEWYDGDDVTPLYTGSTLTIDPSTITSGTIKVNAIVQGQTYSVNIPVYEVPDVSKAQFVFIDAFNGPAEFIFTDGQVNTDTIQLKQQLNNITSTSYKWEYYNNGWQPITDTNNNTPTDTKDDVTGATTDTLTIGVNAPIFSQSNNVLVRCVVNNKFVSNIVNVKKTYNYTKQLVIEQIDGTVFSSKKTQLKFKQKKVDLTKPGIVTDVTNDVTWTLKVNDIPTTITPTDIDGKYYAVVYRSDLASQGAQILEAQAVDVTHVQQVTLNNLNDGYVLDIETPQGTSIYFYSDGTQVPAGQQLNFIPVVQDSMGNVVNLEQQNIQWELIPNQTINGMLINSTSNIPRAYLTTNQDLSATVTVDYGYNDVLQVRCTYTNGEITVSKTVPISIISEPENQPQYITIDQPNGVVYTTQDVNETKTFTVKFIKNNTEQPIIDTENIFWYLNGTEIQQGVTSINVTYNQMPSVTQVLRVLYLQGGDNELTANITLSKLQLAGTTFLVISSSNGNELTYELQSTTLKQTLYVNSEVKTQADGVTYKWYKDGNPIDGVTSDTLAIDTSNVDVYATYTCEATYGGDVYSNQITIIDKTDTYVLKLLTDPTDVNSEKYHYKYSIDATTDLSDINLEFYPNVLLGKNSITSNIEISVIRNSSTYYDVVLNNSKISIPLNILIDPSEITTQSFVCALLVKASYTPQAEPIELEKVITVTIENKLYGWLSDWKNNTTIDNANIATGKLFIGQKNDLDGTLSGVYIGDGSTLDNIQGKTNSYDTAIIQLKDDTEFFKVTTDSNKNVHFFVGDPTSYIKFDVDTTNTFELKSTGVLINNSGFELTDGTINLGSGAIVLNTDGSGQLASGNITWQTNGSGNLANTLVWDNSGNVTISNKLYIKNDSNQIAFALGKNVTTGKDGLYLDENNYWFTTGEFKVGNSNTYVVWDGQNSLAVKGNIYAQGGTIDGDLAVNANLQAGNIMIGKNQAGTNKPGIVVNSNNYWYLDSTTPKFKVGNTNQYILWDGQNLNIYGNIYAQGGSISGDLIVNNTITQSKIDVNNLFSQSIEITGNMHSSGHQNFDDAGAGFWIGKDGSQYKFVVGNRADQKYLEFDGSKTHQVGDLFGQFIGDTYLYNVEIKKDNTYPNSVVYAQDIPQVYRYEETGLELLRTYGSNQHYIVSLQNAQIKPAGVYSPKTGSKTEGQVTDWTTITNPSGTSLTSATGTVFYKIEVQVFKYFPADYFKGKSEGEYAYQTLIFDFSDDVLYNTSYTQSNNTVTISFDPQNRTVTVSLTGVTTSKTLQQRSDITQIKARAYIADKPQSSQVDAGMHYTFTTKDMGHQLAMITIDPDAQGDTLTNFNPDSSSNNVYGIIHQRTFNGVATQAYFADLQEYIWSNEKFEPGTPVQIKKGKVVQQYNPWKKTWIVSTKPGFVMGKGRKNSVPVALAGTVEVNLKQNIDDELCLTLDGKLKVATWLDKIVGKYIIGRVVKILEDGRRLIFLY